jgi:hypothetical protein
VSSGEAEESERITDVLEVRKGVEAGRCVRVGGVRTSMGGEPQGEPDHD